MRLLEINAKKNYIKLKVESPEDLWQLGKILEKGDIVTSRTLRKTSVKRGDKIEHGERIPVILSIKAEKWEFHSDSHSLRITGPILEGPEDMVRLSSYHTLQVKIGSILKIEKEKWKSYQIERLKKARIKQPEIFICVIDREQADFALLKASGIQMKGSLYFRKKEKEERKEFYGQILKILKESPGNIIIIGGPGFEKENLFKFIQEKDSEIGKKIHLEPCSSTGISGIQEIIKRSSSKILKETRIAKETQLIEKFLEEISKDGSVIYGKKETEEALKIGAVEILIVSEDKVHEFEGLLEEAEKMKVKIEIVSSEHENGKRFLSLGGIGGFLRFKIYQ